jgi:hypothetical protein
MPPVAVRKEDLAGFGARWIELDATKVKVPSDFGAGLGKLFDQAVGESLRAMLGGIPVREPSGNSLVPTVPNCVEVGPVKIVGGVRPQRYDVGYRPDGPRFAFDSKTLNSTGSMRKNFLNMVNDLATEATTVHARFPYALVAFMFVLPRPCVDDLPKRAAVAIDTLDRLARRETPDDPAHLAEAISVVVWHPNTGTIDQDIPEVGSRLRLEVFSPTVERIYVARYEGLPPHERAGLPTTPVAEDEEIEDEGGDEAEDEEA